MKYTIEIDIVDPSAFLELVGSAPVRGINLGHILAHEIEKIAPHCLKVTRDSDVPYTGDPEPIWQYECPNCGDVFRSARFVDDDLLTCDKCLDAQEYEQHRLAKYYSEKITGFTL